MPSPPLPFPLPLAAIPTILTISSAANTRVLILSELLSNVESSETSSCMEDAEAETAAAAAWRDDAVAFEEPFDTPEERDRDGMERGSG